METVTLTEFLQARYAEDEALARDASSPSLRAWEVRGLDIYAVAGPPSFNPIARHALGQQGEHMARWDPARVLAECEAKRRIITEVHCRAADHPSYGNGLEKDACAGCGTGGPCDDFLVDTVDDCPTLRLLAHPFSQHADFDPEWRV
jgi:hypothetical protein